LKSYRGCGAMQQQLRVRVTGRVQGVGYRDFTQKAARRLGIDGWVRNLPDGSVEALLCAEAAAIERMLDQLRAGPPFSRVTGVVVTPLVEPVETNGFMIR